MRVTIASCNFKNTAAGMLSVGPDLSVRTLERVMDKEKKKMCPKASPKDEH